MYIYIHIYCMRTASGGARAFGGSGSCVSFFPFFFIYIHIYCMRTASGGARAFGGSGSCVSFFFYFLYIHTYILYEDS